MTKSAAKSALDVANWFFKKAEASRVYLEEDKLHPLVFLAQAHYALKNGMQYLVPGLFVCDNGGIFEPNLKKILEFGMPLMGEPELSNEVKEFLELVWHKYAAKNAFELIGIIKASPAYRKHHVKDETVLLTLEDMAQNFGAPTEPQTAKKIRISQNGPVVVSEWQPRKLNAAKKS